MGEVFLHAVGIPMELFPDITVRIICPHAAHKFWSQNV